MIYEDRHCKYCGKLFTPKAIGQLYCCIDCRKLDYKENEPEEKRKRRLKQMQKPKQKTQAKKKKENRLTERAIAAKAAGMSYGQYVAMLNMRG